MNETNSKSIQNQHKDYELKPCPLCNESAEISTWDLKCEDDSYLKYSVIVCKYCGLTLFGSGRDEYEDVKKEEVKELVRHWNTRTQQKEGW